MQPNADLRRHLRLALLTVFALFPLTGHAQSTANQVWEKLEAVDPDEFDHDGSLEAPWIETETEIPPPPAADDMTWLQLDTLQTGLDMFVDARGIRIDPGDRVVRLWLWLRSDQGSESGTYEGYRCGTGEYKVFAYANPNREPVVRVVNLPSWREIKDTRRANYRRELVQDYLCGYSGMRTVQDIRDAIAGRYESTAFGPD